MKHVLLIDASHLYMGGREILGMPNADFDRNQLLTISRNHIEDSGIELWRIYWFDAPNSEDMAHKVTGLAEFDDVHVVLGSRNSRGAQKGVDANLIRTLTEIAEWPGETVLHVVVGDDDFIPAMNLATSRGLHVRLWYLEDSRSVTPSLRQSVDRTRSVPAQIYARAFNSSSDDSNARQVDEALHAAPRDYGYNQGVTASEVKLYVWKSERPRIPLDLYRSVCDAVANQLGISNFQPEGAQKEVIQNAFWEGFDIGQDIQKGKVDPPN